MFNVYYLCKTGIIFTEVQESFESISVIFMIMYLTNYYEAPRSRKIFVIMYLTKRDSNLGPKAFSLIEFEIAP